MHISLGWSEYTGYTEYTATRGKEKITKKISEAWVNAEIPTRNMTWVSGSSNFFTVWKWRNTAP